MIRIGLTGASGMIGTNLLTRLGQDPELRGRYQPVALVRRESSIAELRARGIETRLVDFAEPQTFHGKLEDLEVVIHLAGLTKAYRKEDFYEVNAGGTRTLLSAAAGSGGAVRHVLFTSSVAACGPAPAPTQPKSEESPCRPLSHYGRSKLQAEDALRASGLNWTILRLPVVLGPHDYEGLRLLRLVRDGWVWTFGREEDYFSYVCAQDLARVVCRIVLDEAFYREIVNVGYDGPGRAMDLYREVRRLLGLDAELRLRHLPRWTAFVAGSAANVVQRLRRKPSYVNLDKAWDLTGKNLVLTNTKLKRKLGWERFEENGALAETVDWFRQRGLL